MTICPTNGRRGFTLIELLVVVAMLAVLAAILFPVFAQARATARKGVCQSNFKQLATAVVMYSQDHDECYPLSVWRMGCVLPNEALQTLIQPYLRNQRILACPENTLGDGERERNPCNGTPPRNEAERQRWFAVKADFGFNYQYLSPMLWDDDQQDYAGVGVSQARVTRPADTVLAADSVWDLDNAGQPEQGGCFTVDPPCRYRRDGSDSFPLPGADVFSWGGWNPSEPRSGGVFGFVWPRHHGMVNVAFADGHVKTTTIAALAAGCDVRDGWAGAITDPAKYLWDLE